MTKKSSLLEIKKIANFGLDGCCDTCGKNLAGRKWVYMDFENTSCSKTCLFQYRVLESMQYPEFEKSGDL